MACFSSPYYILWKLLKYFDYRTGHLKLVLPGALLGRVRSSVFPRPVFKREVFSHPLQLSLASTENEREREREYWLLASCTANPFDQVQEGAFLPHFSPNSFQAFQGKMEGVKVDWKTTFFFMPLLSTLQYFRTKQFSLEPIFRLKTDAIKRGLSATIWKRNHSDLF